MDLHQILDKTDIFTKCLNNLDDISKMKSKYRIYNEKEIIENIPDDIQLKINQAKEQNEQLLSLLNKEVEPAELLKDHASYSLGNGYSFICSPSRYFGNIVYEFFKRGVKIPEDIKFPDPSDDCGMSFISGRISEDEFIKIYIFKRGPLNFYDKVYKDIEDGTVFGKEMTDEEHLQKYLDYAKKHNLKVIDPVQNCIEYLDGHNLKDEY